MLAPSERAVVDVLVDRPGELPWSTTPPTGPTGWPPLTVAEERAGPSAAAGEFEVLRRAPELAAEREQLDRWLAAPPDKVLALVAQMDDPAAMPAGAGPVTYACPMHPEVTSDRARPLSQVRHEAARHPGARRAHRCAYACPDASGGGERPAGALPQVRDEAARGRVCPQAGGRR